MNFKLTKSIVLYNQVIKKLRKYNKKENKLFKNKGYISKKQIKKERKIKKNNIKLCKVNIKYNKKINKVKKQQILNNYNTKPISKSRKNIKEYKR